MTQITVPLSERQRKQIATAQDDFKAAKSALETYTTAVIDGVIAIDESRRLTAWEVTDAGLVVVFAEPALTPPAPALVVEGPVGEAPA